MDKERERWTERHIIKVKERARERERERENNKKVGGESA